MHNVYSKSISHTSESTIIVSELPHCVACLPFTDIYACQEKCHLFNMHVRCNGAPQVIKLMDLLLTTKMCAAPPHKQMQLKLLSAKRYQLKGCFNCLVVIQGMSSIYIFSSLMIRIFVTNVCPVATEMGTDLVTFKGHRRRIDLHACASHFLVIVIQKKKKLKLVQLSLLYYMQVHSHIKQSGSNITQARDPTHDTKKDLYQRHGPISGPKFFSYCNCTDG